MTSVPAAHPAPPEHPERPDGAPERPRAPRWPPWMAPAALFAGFAAAVVGSILLGVVGAIFGRGFDDLPASLNIAAVVVQDACLIGAALLFARIVWPPRPWQFGLNRPLGLRSATGWVILGYVVFLLVSYAWLSAVGKTGTKDHIIEDLGAKDSTAALIGVAFVVAVCAPLAEEFFFRGFFFGALRGMGLWPAALLTGLTFGLVHVAGSPIAFILPLAFLGALLCLIRERTGSLYPGIALHCVNNSFALASNEHWDWQIPVILVAAPATIALIVWLGLRVWPTDTGRLPAPQPA
jgi:hypothetical protein